MAKSAGQKLKLLYIIKFLSETTDENHPVSTADIIAYLDAQGIHSERKSIYDDIDKLCEFGYDIIQVHSRLGGGYYMAGREFELAELKLLVDAVQSSRFITTRKSRSLIRKLEQMAGKYDAGKLQRQVFVAGRIKTENESIYYNVDSIHRAIQENKQIRFQYLDWNLRKQLVPRVNAERTVSPWALIWREENYYLAAFDSTDGVMKHFRVDKMGKTAVLEQKREGMEQFARVDPAAYTNQTFGMYSGDEESVTLQFPNRLIGVVLDRFGRDADIRPMTDRIFRVRVKVAVSGQFFGWLAGIGREAVVVSPASVKEQYSRWLTDIVETIKITDGLNNGKGI
ncbi:MAG: WYL domain-containing protein [Eubacterium sp.]|nr:WYL domain-containing protein [Eubacterium sp.]MCM1214406.1 WYL domain-containing protein [Lachnospiraceae bacterium]MCM1304487.1 WYL domain-containing protein [Butyrivibrio sp.]MCM1342605.1 WYL domain-containing protein [Muribaculaceae bacterium]MCM1238696.1 WYL domain-containing protein [Lachnospiraceae bacterium]